MVDETLSLVFALVPTLLVFFMIAGANLVIFIYVRNTLRPLIALGPGGDTSGSAPRDEEERNPRIGDFDQLRSSMRAKQVREVAIQGKKHCSIASRPGSSSGVVASAPLCTQTSS